VIQGFEEGPPMWTTANRSKYNRDKLRYPSDLTGEEWAHIEALIPAAKHGGRKRKVDVREVVNAIMYVLSTGCQWRYVPKDLPPKSTLYAYFDLWTSDGSLENIHHALYVECREQIGREASPTAAIIDSQSVKSAEKNGGMLVPKRFRTSKSKSSNGRITPEASRFSHTLGCRTHLRMAQPMPATGQGLRKPHPQCFGILASRLDPTHA
jgi:transposase